MHCTLYDKERGGYILSPVEVAAITRMMDEARELSKQITAQTRANPSLILRKPAVNPSQTRRVSVALQRPCKCYIDFSKNKTKR